MPEIRPKFLEYLDAAVRMHGFCIVDAGVAFQLRPELWATRMNCGADFSTDRNVLRKVAERRGAKLLQVSLAGMDRRVPVLTMAEDDRARCIEWITGRRAADICPLADPEPEARAAPQTFMSQAQSAARCGGRTGCRWILFRLDQARLTVGSVAERRPRWRARSG